VCEFESRNFHRDLDVEEKFFQKFIFYVDRILYLWHEWLESLFKSTLRHTSCFIQRDEGVRSMAAKKKAKKKTVKKSKKK